MNWLDELPTITPFRKYSQCGEEGVLGYIFTSLGTPEGGRLIDIGAGDGYRLSNSRWLIESCGWTGLLIDGDTNGAKGVVQSWITKENIVRTCAANGAIPCDLVMIDLDGNDYWILDELLKACKPKVILAEVNPALEPVIAQTIPYDPEHVFDGTDHHGMSLAALEHLGHQHGYTLIHVQASLNGFLLRNDLVPGPVPEIRMERIQGHPHKPNAEWILL